MCVMRRTQAKKVQLTDDSNSVDRVVICFAEFLGTGMLVFIGCMGCVPMSSKFNESLQISFTFGLAIMVAIQCFGHISGCHINPAVTVGAVILGQIPIMLAPVYLCGQFLGAIGGFGLLKVMSPNNISFVSNGNGICSPGPLDSDLQPWQGAVVECALTFVLVTVCAAVWDCRNANNTDSASIRIGLTVAVLAMAGGSYTGANMNPARSLGPALLNGTWENWWIWWTGPLSGGLIAALLYRHIFSREYQIVEHTVSEIMHMNDRA